VGIRPVSAGILAVHDVSVEQLVEQIHGGARRFVLVTTGGGSLAISGLLTASGASRTVLEATVPYSAAALAAWLGARPEHFCSSETARAMAMVAFRRAQSYDPQGTWLAGVACTASLASDRPKQGAHRAHLPCKPRPRPRPSQSNWKRGAAPAPKKNTWSPAWSST
jgi:hypothetical protein